MFLYEVVIPLLHSKLSVLLTGLLIPNMFLFNFRDLDIQLDEDEEDEDAIIEKRRKEREELMRVRRLHFSSNSPFSIFIHSNTFSW
jgi:hypothetical protein